MFIYLLEVKLFTLITITSCTRTNNSYKETVKYLINENYITLILTNVKHFTHYFFRLGTFFRRQKDHMQRESN